ncbi:MAG: hypothetical protein ACI9OJ_003640 [Myxococcota bacterium]|jgi:hypothetical protein
MQFSPSAASQIPFPQAAAEPLAQSAGQLVQSSPLSQTPSLSQTGQPVHPLESTSQPAVQTRAPPVQPNAAQDWPAKSAPSQASVASATPSSQTAGLVQASPTSP